jgi:hypothetical protein
MFPKTSRLLFALALVALALALTTPVTAQVVASDAYQVAYFSQGGFANFMHVINTGQVGSPIDTNTKNGTVCADIYAFDANQEMVSCCSCPITANGLLRREVLVDLTDPGLVLTAFPVTTGVIKVVSDTLPASGVCNPGQISAPVNGALRAFMLNGQGVAVILPGPKLGIGPGPSTETSFQPASLTQSEQSFLGNACSFVLYLGSGRGQCLCGDYTT